MFKVIETEEEFITAAKARVLWGNRGYPDEAPQWDHLRYWDDYSNEELNEIWDDAVNNISEDLAWRTRDFAVLVEDDGEDASPTASEASED